MTTVNQSKRYLGNRSVYFGPDLPETDLEEGFLFYKTGSSEGLYIYKNSTWEVASITDAGLGTLNINSIGGGPLSIANGGTGATTLNINSIGGGPLSIANGGTGATTANAALTALGGVTMTQVQNYVQTSNQNSQGNKTVSTSTPTGGNDGDMWYQYE